MKTWSREEKVQLIAMQIQGFQPRLIAEKFNTTPTEVFTCIQTLRKEVQSDPKIMIEARELATKPKGEETQANGEKRAPEVWEVMWTEMCQAYEGVGKGLEVFATMLANQADRNKLLELMLALDDHWNKNIDPDKPTYLVYMSTEIQKAYMLVPRPVLMQGAEQAQQSATTG